MLIKIKKKSSLCINLACTLLFLIYFLYQTINDPVPEVRESSFEALGTAMQLVGEKNIMPFITDVDNIKQQKVRQALNST